MLFIEVTQRLHGGYSAVCRRFNWTTEARDLGELHDSILGEVSSRLGATAMPPLSDIHLVLTRETI